jgi:MFS transporter, DHA2 family, multidrug resistance protein
MQKSNYKWMVLITVMIGTLMSSLDSSIVNVSLPSMMADFGVGIDDIEWTITGYMLSFAVFMPVTTYLRSKIGGRNLYLASLVIFTAGSLLCGMAWNLGALVGARVLQAVGGGAIIPSAMTMITEVFPKHERGQAIGYWGVGAICGPAFGPTVGGYLTQLFGWRSIFMVNLPIGIAGILVAMALLEKDAADHKAAGLFDGWGFAFLTVFLVSFLLGLSKGDHEGWTSVYIITCFTLALFSFIGFLTVEFQVTKPIMDLELLKSPVFAACFILTIIRSIALYGGTFLLPLFLQRQMGLDEITTGLILLPGSLAIGVVMPLAGRLSDRIGPRLLSMAGLFFLAYFMFMYRHLDTTTSIYDIIMPTMVRGLGVGLLIAPVTATAMNAVAPDKHAMASSMLNLIQQVSGSLGIGALATILNVRTHFHLGLIGGNLNLSSLETQQRIAQLAHHALDIGRSHAEAQISSMVVLMHNIADTAIVSAYQDAFIAAGVITALSIFTAMLLPNSPSALPEGEVAILE